MIVTILRTTGSTEEHECDLEAVFKQIEKLIGADMLDHVNLRDGRMMWVDDIGTYTYKLVNPEATRLYHSVCVPGTTQPIIGDVAITHEKDWPDE